MAAKQTCVHVVGRDVVFQFAKGDAEKATQCIRKNGMLKFRFSELRVREFPVDMTFMPRAVGPGHDIADFADGGHGGDGGNDID